MDIICIYNSYHLYIFSSFFISEKQFLKGSQRHQPPPPPSTRPRGPAADFDVDRSRGAPATRRRLAVSAALRNVTCKYCYGLWGYYHRSETSTKSYQ